MMSTSFKIFVGIATTGRRAQMGLTLAQLARQTLQPDRIVVCPAADADFDPADATRTTAPLQIVQGERGSASQRNAILRACGEADLLLFIDDDFYPADDYIERLVQLFASHADIVLATNQPDLDGATGPGVSHDAALAVLRQSALQQALAGPGTAVETYGGYGCNMTVRMATVRQLDVWFDEALPLYGWLEDIDFSRRPAAGGGIVQCSALHGVHLATKVGRTSGVRFGYSQVANPVYLMHKGSMSRRYGLRQMARNVAKNLLRVLWPEPWVDRRGRLKGNALALLDMLRGQLHPGRVRAL